MHVINRLFLISVVLLLSACGREQAGEPVSDAEPEAAFTVLVTGATGTQGGAVVTELLSRGFGVRALTRSPEKPTALALSTQGAAVYKGDFDDAASLDSAMQGVDAVFAVTDFWEHGHDSEIAHGQALIAAAVRAGVAHFVFSSVAGAEQDTGLAHFDSKYQIEQALRDSGLDFTILRPVEFMDNWRYSREQLLAGEYANPRDPSDHHQWIAASDIGFFVGEAIEFPQQWLGRAQAIAGDEMTLAELVVVMSGVFDRPVQYQQVGWEEFATAMGAELTDMYRWFATDGYDVDVAALRAQYPDLVTVRQYLRDLAAAGPGD